MSITADDVKHAKQILDLWRVQGKGQGKNTERIEFIIRVFKELTGDAK